MKRFAESDVREAYAFAEGGGQALHIFNETGRFDHMTRIPVFLQNHPWAHLIDNDLERLKRTARRLGVRKLVVGREGRRGQHIDLCAGPLAKALLECETEGT